MEDSPGRNAQPPFQGVGQKGLSDLTHTMSTKDLRESLRDGRYAWPGGYEKFYICVDSGILCDPCVRKEYRSVLRETKYGLHGGWGIAGVDCTANADESDVICDHCGTVIFKSEQEASNGC